MSLLTELGIFSIRFSTMMSRLRRCSFRRCCWCRRGGFLYALHGRVFFHVAGDDPFGEALRVVFVGIVHDGVQHVQGDGRLVRGVLDAAGRSALCRQARALGADGGFIPGDVRVELRDEGGRQADADKLRGESGGIRGEGVCGVEHVLCAVIAGHEKFPIESGGAEENEGIRAVGDGLEIIVEQFVGDGLGFDAGFFLAAAGGLSLRQTGGRGHGGADEGELLSADADGRKVRGVFDAKGGGGFEGCEQTFFVEVHMIPFNWCFVFFP